MIRKIPSFFNSDFESVCLAPGCKILSLLIKRATTCMIKKFISVFPSDFESVCLTCDWQNLELQILSKGCFL